MASKSLDLSYIGERIRIIRHEILGKSQSTMASEMNSRYDTDAFNQPRINQIEAQSGLGKSAWRYINYLCELGFNSNWILIEDNQKVNQRNVKTKTFDLEAQKLHNAHIKAIKKTSEVIKLQLDELTVALQELL